MLVKNIKEPGRHSDGERAAAKNHAEAIAAKPGLCLATALSMLDAQKPAPHSRTCLKVSTIGWRSGIEIDCEFARDKEENHAFRARVTEDLEILRAAAVGKSAKRKSTKKPDPRQGELGI